MHFRTLGFYFIIISVLGRMTFGYSLYGAGSLSSTLDTFHQSVCDGKTMLVKCPRNTQISIQFAQYGRQVPSSQMCPQAILQERSYSSLGYLSALRNYHKEDTNCQATTSLQVLLDLCQNRHSCHLVASARTFSQDPCPNTSKYLEVAYKCQPDGYESKVVCEGEQMVLWCKRSTRVAIHSAMFGRTPNGTSECKRAGPSHINCQAHNTVEAVRKQCHGRKQCALEAEEYMFGNPCEKGVKKYLNVTYTCVPKKIFKASHRKEKKRHHKKNRKRKEKNDKKPLRSSSTDAEVYTKHAPETSTVNYKTLKKTVTPKPEQASADAADTEEVNISSPSSTEKKEPVHPYSPIEPESKDPDLIVPDTPKPGSNNTNLTVVCVNNSATVGHTLEGGMGIMMEWLNAVDFIETNMEKVVLYFALGVCVGIIILLIVIICKIGRDYKRQIRAKLDVTEPTHSHNVTSNHHPLDGALERAESIDRIEVVRFSPRGTLRNDQTRSLSNYYG